VNRPTVYLAWLGAVACAVFVSAVAPAGTVRRGVYSDPLGRYRFTFEGAWRVGADEEDPAALDHFYLIKRGRVAAEVVITTRPFPASSRLSDFVDAEIDALDAESAAFRVSVKRNMTIAGRPAVRLIARLDEPDGGPSLRGARAAGRETLAAQYWFVKDGELWSLLVVTTPAKEERSKVISAVERTVISTFEALEPDEVGQAIADSQKVARLASGLAAITVPERWTLLEVGRDVIAAEFGLGRVYLFAVEDHEYGDTLREVAHGFVELHAALNAPQVKFEAECDVRGRPGYTILFDGTREGRPFRVQLVALTSGPHALFLYGIAEVDAWPAAQPWITAVQYTIEVVDIPEPPPSQEPDDTGGTPEDAGPVPEDAGPVPEDAEPVPEDAGPVPEDAGPTPENAG
jgi:hypothetical protein